MTRVVTTTNETYVTTETENTVVSANVETTMISSVINKSLTRVKTIVPVLLSVVSRKTHGAAGVFDLPIDITIPVTGNVTCEPRSNAIDHKIVFNFDQPIISVGSVTSVDSVGAAVGSASAVISGNSVIVTIVGAANKKRCLVTINNINGISVATVALGLLIGDVNNSRFNNTSDHLLIQGHDGETTNTSNFIYDIDLNGIVEGAFGVGDRQLCALNGGPLGT